MPSTCTVWLPPLNDNGATSGFVTEPVLLACNIQEKPTPVLNDPPPVSVIWTVIASVPEPGPVGV